MSKESSEKLITKDYITEVIAKEYGKNAIIKNITETGGFGGGENYASDLLRVTVELKLKDGEDQILSYIYKAIPQAEMIVQMSKMMGLLPKEIEIYTTILPKFVELYKSFGKTVAFGPKLHYVRPDKEAFIIDDLKPTNFRNGKRQLGLNMNEVEKTLKKLAEYHAASAVIYEKEGYSDFIMKGAFNEDIFPMMLEMQKSIMKVYVNCLNQYESLRPYIRKFENLVENSMEMFKEFLIVHPDMFNVLNHGDLWCNNIMFQYDENDNVTETYFIDYAVAKYGSPSQDLWYFLMSSCEADIKINKFDYFIKYYHEHLIENLKLLQYPKKLPSLVSIQIQLLKDNLWAISTVQGVLGIALIDPTELATVDNFMSDSDAGIKFKEMTYKNPRYIKALEVLLPWLDNKGLLDV